MSNLTGNACDCCQYPYSGQWPWGGFGPEGRAPILQAQSITLDCTPNICGHPAWIPSSAGADNKLVEPAEADPCAFYANRSIERWTDRLKEHSDFQTLSCGTETPYPCPPCPRPAPECEDWGEGISCCETPEVDCSGNCPPTWCCVTDWCGEERGEDYTITTKEYRIIEEGGEWNQPGDFKTCTREGGCEVKFKSRQISEESRTYNLEAWGTGCAGTALVRNITGSATYQEDCVYDDCNPYALRFLTSTQNTSFDDPYVLYSASTTDIVFDCDFQAEEGPANPDAFYNGWADDCGPLCTRIQWTLDSPATKGEELMKFYGPPANSCPNGSGTKPLDKDEWSFTEAIDVPALCQCKLEEFMGKTFPAWSDECEQNPNATNYGISALAYNFDIAGPNGDIFVYARQKIRVRFALHTPMPSCYMKVWYKKITITGFVQERLNPENTEVCPSFDSYWSDAETTTTESFGSEVIQIKPVSGNLCCDPKEEYPLCKDGKKTDSSFFSSDITLEAPVEAGTAERIVIYKYSCLDGYTPDDPDDEDRDPCKPNCIPYTAYDVVRGGLPSNYAPTGCTQESLEEQ